MANADYNYVYQYEETDSEPETIVFNRGDTDAFNFESLDPELHTTLIESFEMDQPVSEFEKEHKINVSPIRVPSPSEESSLKSVFCSGCLISYNQHEMHLFQDCGHGLCKHECAQRYTLPYCPECKVCILSTSECQKIMDRAAKQDMQVLVENCIDMFLKEMEMTEQHVTGKRQRDCECDDETLPIQKK